MKAYALLGGPEEEWPQNIKNDFVLAQQKNDLLIGVDRGSLLLEEMGLIPDLAIGDFDSLEKSELAKIDSSVPDIRYSSPIKDATDSELMVKIAFEDYHLDSLTILGATGGRIDHFLVNLFMILNPKINRYAEKITLLDKQNLLNFYIPGQHVINRKAGYNYVGVADLSGVKDLNIEGARYELANYSNSYPLIFGSNEFLPDKDTFEISFKKGTVAIIYSKDINRFHNI